MFIDLYKLQSIIVKYLTTSELSHNKRTYQWKLNKTTHMLYLIFSEEQKEATFLYLTECWFSELIRWLNSWFPVQNHAKRNKKCKKREQVRLSSKSKWPWVSSPLRWDIETKYVPCLHVLWHHEWRDDSVTVRNMLFIMCKQLSIHQRQRHSAGLVTRYDPTPSYNMMQPD